MNPQHTTSQLSTAANGHKRNGAIAQLPKSTRDQINQWLDDGHSYPQIIRDLGDPGKTLKPAHLSSWFKGGYQDHLRQQEWRSHSQLLLESASHMTELSQAPQTQQTLIQIALLELFRTLKDRDIQPDSPQYIRLFNALARLSREALVLRKYADQREAQATQTPATLDPARNLDGERNLIMSALERALGVKASPAPIGPDLNEHFGPQWGPAPDNLKSEISNLQSAAPQPGDLKSELSNLKLTQPPANGAAEIPASTFASQPNSKSEIANSQLPPSAPADLQSEISNSSSVPTEQQTPPNPAAQNPTFAPPRDAGFKSEILNLQLPPATPNSRPNCIRKPKWKRDLRKAAEEAPINPEDLVLKRPPEHFCPHCKLYMPTAFDGTGKRIAPICPHCFAPLDQPTQSHTE